MRRTFLFRYQIPSTKEIAEAPALDRPAPFGYSPGMPHHDVVILGAGASGLCCALFAARRGRGVTLVDHGPVAARKVRISGGGRCNFTHLDACAEDYSSANPAFVRSALARFGPWDAVALLAELGLGYEEKNPGQLFCSQGAPALARAMEQACRNAGAGFLLRRSIEQVQRTDAGYRVHTDHDELTCDHLVLALGGPSWPDAGATDLGMRLAAGLGLSVLPPRPALVPFVLPPEQQKLCRELAGVSLRARLQAAGHVVEDDLLFTHKGLSGPAALQLSLYWQRGQAMHADLLPGLNLSAELREARQSKTRLKNHLAHHIPARVAGILLPPALAEKPLCELSNADLDRVVAQLTAFPCTPQRTEGMLKAEVAAGGVDTREISSKTMQARNCPGLFVIGELLDVTGKLGGYNLQWAWSSGHAAAQYV